MFVLAQGRIPTKFWDLQSDAWRSFHGNSFINLWKQQDRESISKTPLTARCQTMEKGRSCCRQTQVSRRGGDHPSWFGRVWSGDPISKGSQKSQGQVKSAISLGPWPAHYRLYVRELRQFGSGPRDARAPPFALCSGILGPRKLRLSDGDQPLASI